MINILDLDYLYDLDRDMENIDRGSRLSRLWLSTIYIDVKLDYLDRGYG